MSSPLRRIQIRLMKKRSAEKTRWIKNNPEGEKVYAYPLLLAKEEN